MKRFINVLHLSDYHHQDSTWFSESQVVQALLDDLRALRDSELAPDLAIFSGDLVFAADQGRYSHFEQNVLRPVAEAAGLPPEHVLICPGNHDASQKLVLKRSAGLATLRDAGESDERMRQVLASGELQDHAANVFSLYQKFANSFYGRAVPTVDPLIDIIKIDELELKIAALNSAAVTDAATKVVAEDKGHLWVAEPITAQANTAGAEILFQHHPVAWMTDPAQKFFEPAFVKSVKLFLFGHMHDVRPMSYYDGNGRRTQNQAGALFYGSHRNNTYKGYALISLDRETSKSKVHHQEYFEPRSAFARSPTHFSEGVYYCDEKAERHFAIHMPRFNRPELIKWKSTILLDQLMEAHGKALSEGGPFVDLDFEIIDPLGNTPLDDETAPHRLETASLSSLMTRQDHLLLSGEQECGKSRSLLEWALRRSADVSDTRVPALISWDDFRRGGVEAIQKLIRKALMGLPAGFTHDDLLRRGSVDVLIDDFLVRPGNIEALGEVLQAFPMCRFVIAEKSAPGNLLGLGSIVPNGVPFTTVRIRQMRPSTIRVIVKRLSLDPLGEESLLRDIHREVIQNNLPLTPFTISSIVEIYQRENSIRFSNKANFVERLIEIKLEKHRISEIDVSAFDFDNKMHCLSEFAAWMVENDQYTPAVQDAEGWFAQYILGLGLPTRAMDLVKQFERAAILVEVDGRMRFRLRIYLEYFIACKMATDTDFRDRLLSENEYLAFQNEITLYFAKTRNNAALLDVMATRLNVLRDELIERETLTANAAERLDRTAVAEGKEEAKDLEAISRTLRLPTLSDEERDLMLDAETPPDVGSRQEVYRPNITDAGGKWAYSLLLYSSLIRFSDFLPSDVKQRHVSNAIDHWIAFLEMSMSIIPHLVETGKLRMNGVEYELKGLLTHTKAQRLRILQMGMPIGVSRLLSYYMNSEKLRMQIRADSKDEAAVKSYLRSALLLDMPYEGIGADLEGFIEKVSSSQFVRRLLLRKGIESFVRRRIPERDQLRYKKSLSSEVSRMRATLPNKGRVARDQAADSFMNRLERQKLTVALGEGEDSLPAGQHKKNESPKKKRRRSKRKNRRS